jgi:hypothetical protein
MAFICHDLAANVANLHIVRLFGSAVGGRIFGSSWSPSPPCSSSSSRAWHVDFRGPSAHIIDLDLAAFDLVIFGSDIVLGHDHFVGFAGGIKLTFEGFLTTLFVVGNSIGDTSHHFFMATGRPGPTLLQVLGPSIQGTYCCPIYRSSTRCQQ